MSILGFIEREWNVVFIEEGRVQTAIATECPWGSTREENKVDPGFCVHGSNKDPANTGWLRKGRCVESYCPSKKPDLTVKKSQ